MRAAAARAGGGGGSGARFFFCAPRPRTLTETRTASAAAFSGPGCGSGTGRHCRPGPMYGWVCLRGGGRAREKHAAPVAFFFFPLALATAVGGCAHGQTAVPAFLFLPTLTRRRILPMVQAGVVLLAARQAGEMARALMQGAAKKKKTTEKSATARAGLAERSEQ